MKTSKSNKGFTLLEVLIAISILSFMAMYTTQSIRGAFTAKAKIQKDIDKSTLAHSAVRLIKEDFKKAFNYIDINVDLYNKTMQKRIDDCKESANKGGSKTPDPKDPTPTDPNTPAPTSADKQKLLAKCKKMEESFKPRTHTKVTVFQGEKDAVNFTTLNNIRAIVDSKVSDQAEIGYFLKTCRSRKNKSKSSQCLWRRVSTILDDKIDEGGSETALLEHVTKFELRYLGPEKEGEWVDTWKSGEGSDDVTKDRFPHAVEITLTIHNKDMKKDKAYSISVVAPIRFPNNPKKEEAKQGTAKPAGGSSGSNG